MSSAANIIEIEHLSRTFQVGELTVPALRDVSLEIVHGDFVAIMGPSGSGKSTLMNILGCLDKPSSGTYRLDGIAVQGMGRDQLAEIRNREIGFVFQQFNLLPRTSAIENVELPLLYTSNPLRDPHARAMEALGSVGLADRASHHPNQLSGGRSSASPSRGRSSTIRRSFWRMSRPERSIRAPASKSWRFFST